MSKPQRLGHIPELDGLRAVAIAIVFFGHLKLVPMPSGFGVTVFFFLSGFLITTLLRIEHGKTGDVSLRGFYWRRFLRIQPPLYITMAVIAAITLFGLIDNAMTPLDVVSQIFFFSNYVPNFGQVGGLASPLWSLAVEEHFYLVFPLLFLIAARRFNSRQIAIFCAVASFAALMMRCVNVWWFDIYEANYYWSHTRMDSILAGCILALWRNPLLDEDSRVGLPATLTAGAALLATFLFRDEVFRETLRYTVQNVALWFCFAYVLQGHAWTRVLLGNAVMVRIGVYSYTIYLIHYAVMLSVEGEFAGIGRLGQVLLIAAVTVAYAATMNVLVERPLARIRKRRGFSRPLPADLAGKESSVEPEEIRASG